MEKSASPASVTVTRFDPFGPPSLFEREDAAAYDELLERVSHAVKPKDFIEEIWVRDIVDLAWDAYRLRRLKAAGLMAVSIPKGFVQVLEKPVDWHEARELAKGWVLHDQEARNAVGEILDQAGLTWTLSWRRRSPPRSTISSASIG